LASRLDITNACTSINHLCCPFTETKRLPWDKQARPFQPVSFCLSSLSYTLAASPSLSLTHTRCISLHLFNHPSKNHLSPRKMSEKASLPAPSSPARASPGCLSIFKGLFISEIARDAHLGQTMNVILLFCYCNGFIWCICTKGTDVFIPIFSVVLRLPDRANIFTFPSLLRKAHSTLHFTFSSPTLQEKEPGLFSSSDTSHAHPPAYDSLPQEMSERLLANANLAATQAAGVLLTELWEQDEFAKTVHEAIERVSTELRHVSLKVELVAFISA